MAVRGIRTRVLHVTMSPAEWDRFSGIAERLGWSRSYLARRALELAEEQEARLRAEGPPEDAYRWRGQ